MAWHKQFGGGTQMGTSYTFLANGFSFNHCKSQEEYLSWANNFANELNLNILNTYCQKDKIYVVFDGGSFSIKFVKRNSVEAEFEFNSDYSINIDKILKNLEENLLIVDPCHVLLSKNFYFTVEKAEGFHLKNEAIVWIN